MFIPQIIKKELNKWVCEIGLILFSLIACSILPPTNPCRFILTAPRVLLNPICLLTFPLFLFATVFTHSPAHVSLMVGQRRSLQYLEWRPSEVNIGYIAPRAGHGKDCTSPDPQTRSWWRGEDFRTWKLIHFFIYLILENSNASKE